MEMTREIPHRWGVLPVGLQRSLLVFFASLLLFLLSITVVDVDLWGHLRFGLDNLESGRLVRQDQYSYMTGEVPWINHEWLAETLFAVAWTLAKSAGLIGLKLIVSLATVYLIVKEWVRQGVNLVLAGSFLALGIGLATTDFSTVRPQIFTVLMFTALLVILLRVEDDGYRWLWGVPPVMLLWANLHGGFLAGLGVFTVWGGVHIWRKRPAWLPVLLALVAGVVATWINPYGLQLFLFLLRTATIPRPEIWEWNPVELTTPFGLVYLALLGISILGLIFSQRRLTVERFVLFVLMAIMPLLARRHLSLFAVSTSLLVGSLVSAWIESWGLWGRLHSWVYRAVMITAGLLALILLPFTGSNLSRIAMPVTPPYPIQAVGLLKEINASGNMVAEFSWGEYVIWHLGPQVQVSMDGRRETVYAKDDYEMTLRFFFGMEGWDELIDNHPVDMILVGRLTTVYNLLSLKPGWELAFEDEYSALFLPSGSPWAAPLQAAIDREIPWDRDYRFP